MTETIKIAACDPGKIRDSFGFVIIEVKDGKIYLRGAERWLGRPYKKIVEKIVQYNEEFEFNRIVVERNNVGESVIERFKLEHKIRVMPVFTSKNLKDEKKIRSQKTMDKNEMVNFIASLKQEHKIRFPKYCSKDMKELKRQISIFAEHRTESGQISYYAEGKEHDDLVMAFMLACFVGRRFLRGRPKCVVKHVKFSHDRYDYLGSGIPQGAQHLGRTVFLPQGESVGNYRIR